MPNPRPQGHTSRAAGQSIEVPREAYTPERYTAEARENYERDPERPKSFLEKASQFMRNGVKSVMHEFQEGGFLKKAAIVAGVGGLALLGINMIRSAASVLSNSLQSIFHLGEKTEEKLSETKTSTLNRILRWILGTALGGLLGIPTVSAIYEAVKGKLNLTETIEAWKTGGVKGLASLIFQKEREGLISMGRDASSALSKTLEEVKGVVAEGHQLLDKAQHLGDQAKELTRPFHENTGLRSAVNQFVDEPSVSSGSKIIEGTLMDRGHDLLPQATEKLEVQPQSLSLLSAIPLGALDAFSNEEYQMVNLQALLPRDAPPPSDDLKRDAYRIAKFFSDPKNRSELSKKSSEKTGKTFDNEGINALTVDQTVKIYFGSVVEQLVIDPTIEVATDWSTWADPEHLRLLAVPLGKPSEKVLAKWGPQGIESLNHLYDVFGNALQNVFCRISHLYLTISGFLHGISVQRENMMHIIDCIVRRDRSELEKLLRSLMKARGTHETTINLNAIISGLFEITPTNAAEEAKVLLEHVNRLEKIRNFMTESIRGNVNFTELENFLGEIRRLKNANNAFLEALQKAPLWRRGGAITLKQGLFTNIMKEMHLGELNLLTLEEELVIALKNANANDLSALINRMGGSMKYERMYRRLTHLRQSAIRMSEGNTFRAIIESLARFPKLEATKGVLKGLGSVAEAAPVFMIVGSCYDWFQEDGEFKDKKLLSDLLVAVPVIGPLRFVFKDGIYQININPDTGEITHEAHFLDPKALAYTGLGTLAFFLEAAYLGVVPNKRWLEFYGRAGKGTWTLVKFPLKSMKWAAHLPMTAASAVGPSARAVSRGVRAAGPALSRTPSVLRAIIASPALRIAGRALGTVGLAITLKDLGWAWLNHHESEKARSMLEEARSKINTMSESDQEKLRKNMLRAEVLTRKKFGQAIGDEGKYNLGMQIEFGTSGKHQIDVNPFAGTMYEEGSLREAVEATNKSLEVLGLELYPLPDDEDKEREDLVA